MKAIKEEFPNPVLATGRDDYSANCHFYTSFVENEITVDAESITIPIKYTLQCNGLQDLVDAKQAAVIVSVKSSAASYSKLFRFPEGASEMSIPIPKFGVVKNIELIGSIVAAQNIDRFCCPGEFNDMYFGSSTFEIRKGDILALEDSRIIYVDDSELEKPISSIFDIKRQDDLENEIEPNFYGEKIEIKLKSELYDLYYKFKDFNNGALRRYSAGIIVYPVLVEAITYILGHYQSDDGGSSDADYSGKRWFRAIDHKVDKMGLDLRTYQESPTTLANVLLGNIALDALKSFKDTLDSEINSGETQMIGGVD